MKARLGRLDDTRTHGAGGGRVAAALEASAPRVSFYFGPLAADRPGGRGGGGPKGRGSAGGAGSPGVARSLQGAQRNAAEIRSRPFHLAPPRPAQALCS